MTEVAPYLYAVVSAGARLPNVRGVAGEMVEVIEHDGLAVVLGNVRVDVLAGVSKPEEVGVLATRHNDVVNAALNAADAVLPFRLGTVLRDLDAVHTYLADRSEELHDALDHVAHSREWGVTVREAPSAPATPAQPTTSGAAYLARRREELARADERRRARMQARDEISGVLRALATSVADGSHRDSDILLDENYLVTRDAEPAFLDAADRCAEAWLARNVSVQISGPWPAYSFAPRVDNG